MKKIAFLLIALLPAILYFIFFNERQELRTVTIVPREQPTQAPDSPKTIQTEDPQRHQDEFAQLMQSVTQEDILPGMMPVVITRKVNGKHALHAMGGKLIQDGTVLTCAHAFWQNPFEPKSPGEFYFRTVRPHDPNYYPINRLDEIGVDLSSNPNPSLDAIRCIPGPVSIIDPIDPKDHVQTGSKSGWTMSKYVTKQDVRSLLTGKKFYIIGRAVSGSGKQYEVIDRYAFPGESGSIFVGKVPGRLYVLSIFMEVSEKMKIDFELNDSSGIILCSQVKVASRPL